MRNFFYLIFLFLFAGFLNSQTDQCVYKNDFSDPYLFFSEVKTENGRIWCRDGKYHMEYYDTLKWRNIQYISYNSSEDYTIETAISLLNNRRNDPYGIAFSYKDLENANYFVCRPDGYAKVFSIENDMVVTVIDWKFIPELKTKGNYNRLKIKRQSGKFYFYINDSELGSAQIKFAKSTHFGFYAGGPMTIEADYINVLQKKAPINLIPTFDQFGEKVQLGPEINSSYGEKRAVISPDGKFLLVNRENHPGNVGGLKEDIWISEMQNGKWSELKNIGWPLNNKDENYVAGISADNTTLLLGNIYSDGTTESQGGFSISYKTSNGWSKPKALKIKNYYNNNLFNGACISADKNILMLTIERDDSKGEKDLYVSFRNADSSFSEPMNLGNVVNSAGGEFGPYLAPDSKTLYFTSDGHPGYGQADIFVAKRLDDTWKNWSVPQNLGPKVNTKYWDGYISISAASDYAYISSTLHGRTDLDCYRIKLPDTSGPEPVVLLHGKVFNEKTKKVLDAAIKLVDASNGKIIKELDAAIATGEYSIIIDKPGKYHILSRHDGFISINKTVEVLQVNEYKEMKLDLFLTPLEKGATLILNNIFFPPNEFLLLSESYDELSKLIKIMKENPSVKILVSGHTSKNNEGDKFNEELSTSRALAVKNYLVENGVDEERVQFKGHGCSKPIYLEVDEEHQALNRRVEITVLAK